MSSCIAVSGHRSATRRVESCDGGKSLVYRFIEVYPLLSKGRECLKFLPAMDNGAGIDFRDPLEDAVAEFLPRVYPDVSQESARHFAEKRLRDVEPRTVGGSEHILETVGSGC